MKKLSNDASSTAFTGPDLCAHVSTRLPFVAAAQRWYCGAMSVNRRSGAAMPRPVGIRYHFPS
jgi:hypothetical protein